LDFLKSSFCAQEKIFELINDRISKAFDLFEFQNTFSKIRLDQLRDVVLERLATPSSDYNIFKIIKNSLKIYKCFKINSYVYIL
jgi:hypothetical protein